MSEQVVDLNEVGNGIVLIRMQDKKNKNTFTKELAQGLIEAFRSIQTQEQCKAVIITGFDNYFASGGTQEGLLAISDGKAEFTDIDLYSLALNCQVPVIAAMQGHAIGGGFAMGLFADFVVLSRESIYTTNFMRYGFTPGMGSTMILPAKLGLSLAQELMMVARNYRGEELQMRGIPFPVLPRDKVLEYALELARDLVEKPRVSLITLKDHLVANLRGELDNAIKKEIAMHEKTFHLPEVRQRIQTLFGN